MLQKNAPQNNTNPRDANHTLALYNDFIQFLNEWLFIKTFKKTRGNIY